MSNIIEVKENPNRLPDPNRVHISPLYPNLVIRQRAYKTPEELAAKIDDFFTMCASHTEEVMSASGQIKNISRPLIPTEHALAMHLGISLRTFHNYKNHKDYETLHDVANMASEIILGLKTVGLVNNKGNVEGIKFDLKNNYGWKDKFDVDSDNKNETIIKVTYE